MGGREDECSTHVEYKYLLGSSTSCTTTTTRRTIVSSLFARPHCTLALTAVWGQILFQQTNSTFCVTNCSLYCQQQLSLGSATTELPDINSRFTNTMISTVDLSPGMYYLGWVEDVT